MSVSGQGFWAAVERDGGRRIEDYGLIGDSETAALVSRTGSIDWLCWPRFDSEASMTALLGGGDNGYWRIAPTDAVGQHSWKYRDETLILESLFETKSGIVRLIDFMPIRGRASDIVRIVEGVSGRVKMRSRAEVRFEYGQLNPLLRRIEDREVSALAGPHAVVLRSSEALVAGGGAIDCEFELKQGERATFVLTYFGSHLDAPDPVEPDQALEDTEKFWEDWARKCIYEGPYRKQVVRSLVTLKALTYRPTGGTVAAATSSLPETPGGKRNWDYRFCWLRDAAFMLLSFVHAGYPDEAAAWRNWLLRAVAGEPHNVKPLYCVDGDQGILEIEAPWLAGFNGARPVRFGNAAHDQLQLDVFGEIIDAFHLARKHGLDHHDEAWHLQRNLIKALEQCWCEPDAGIWEVRSKPQHFVHSKALAWAAFDRGARCFEGHEQADAVERWAGLRDCIKEEVLKQGFDKERNSFVRAYGSKHLDASALVLPMIGFIDPMDERALGTTAAIERELMPDGLVLRYRTDLSEDGLDEPEGAFLPCSFWLVDNYHLQKRGDDAHALFERLIGLTNDLGLLSEEYDPAERRMLGNFPQAFTHVGLVNSAMNLSEGRGPAEDRLGIDG